MRQLLHASKIKVRHLPVAIRQKYFDLKHHASLPVLKGYAGNRLAIKALFEHTYQQYITEISAVNWAASLETCCVLYYLCQKTHPKIVVDMGSGFSSYVLRAYQANEHPDVTIYSLDDNAVWLTKTREFLKENGGSEDNLLLWEDFRAMAPLLKTDLIFYDLATPRVRIPFLQELLRYTHQDTIIVLDDIHKKPMRAAVMQWIQQNDLKFLNLQDLTLDQINRFAWCVHGFS